MSSIRALTRPRRANSARAAATRASLALGSAGRGIWRGWMTGRSETVRVNERRVKNRQQVSDWQVINAGKVECFLTDARQLAARRQAPHLAGRLGEVRMGRGKLAIVAVCLLACVEKKSPLLTCDPQAQDCSTGPGGAGRCTRDADCGGGVCKLDTGTCQAPQPVSQPTACANVNCPPGNFCSNRECIP